MQPVEGDSELHGKEEGLSFYTDEIYRQAYAQA
jgi:hypothetical protein